MLKRGVNLGNMLEAPHEGDWGQHLQPEYFTLIKQAGFDFVRLPIRWSGHVSGAPTFIIDPVFFKRVDWAIGQARNSGLRIILDYHNDDELMKDPDRNEDRFVGLWKQIAEHYQAEPPDVLFELLNEPFGKLDGPRWNALLARTLALVRSSNPDRTVVIGPVQWNNMGALAQLVLPEADQNILVTVHFYDPMSFTHQGADWIEGSKQWLGSKWEGSDPETLAVRQAFQAAADWGVRNRRPLFLGEFGSFSKGDLESRVRWTDFVARAAEAHGFPWSYWEFSSGFGVYDPVAKAWRKPLLEALLK